MSQHADLTNGTDYVSDEEFENLISDLGLIIEEARATDYHDTLRKATLFLNLHRSKVFEYAKTIARLEACLKRANSNHEEFERKWYLSQLDVERLTIAGNEQLAAYNKACERADMVNDPEHAKAVVRSVGYCLVTRNFVEHFADFIHDYVKGDFDLPELAAIDVQGCFDAWQEEVNQKEVVINLQAEPAAEPSAYQYRMKAEWHEYWQTWQPCDKAQFDDCVKAPNVNGWQYEVRKLYTSPKAAEPVPMTEPRKYLQDADLGDLMRFQETSDDGEGYDLSEASIARLAEIGCLKSHGRKEYSITMFGFFALEHMFKQDSKLPLMTDSDRTLAHNTPPERDFAQQQRERITGVYRPKQPAHCPRGAP